MIVMSQLKLPVETVCEAAPLGLVRQGIIGGQEEALVAKAIGRALGIREADIHSLVIVKKSVDARRKDQIQFVYQVSFETAGEHRLVKRYGKKDAQVVQDGRAVSGDSPGMRLDSKRGEGFGGGGPGRYPPVVAGMGPAGLFAALELARAGVCPIVLERGADVDRRQQAVTAFWDTGELDVQTNVQFGEGGAGTFSDGKLNTQVRDKAGRGRKVLQTLVDFGAPSEILYLQKPHIGTDRLRDVVKAMRQEIIALGGQVRFDAVLEQAVWEQGVLKEILVRHGGRQERMPCHTLILAIGHSARDTVERLYQDGLHMEAKPFAVGVRVEHPQEMIGQNQYGRWHTKLPAAEYKLTYTTQAGRGVYSFCMCPGGFVVNASSERGYLAVNGMSNYGRDGANANSAIVVTVSPEDFGSVDTLAGIAFQRKWERAAFLAGKGKIPVQLLGDFLQDRESTGLGMVSPCMKGAYSLANVRQALPVFVGDAVAEGMAAFGRRIQGYSREDALLSGIESRTSSPVRIPRDDRLQANITGIYPCGEGAGYAGGITSAAMDGIRVAQAVLGHKGRKAAQK